MATALLKIRAEASRWILVFMLASTALQVAAPAASYAVDSAYARKSAEERAVEKRQRNMIRGGVFGVIVVMIGFGVFYVMAHTGMTGDLGPRFFSAPLEQTMVKVFLLSIVSVGVFAALGSLGISFGFVDILLGPSEAELEEEFFQGG